MHDPKRFSLNTSVILYPFLIFNIVTDYFFFNLFSLLIFNFILRASLFMPLF